MEWDEDELSSFELVERGELQGHSGGKDGPFPNRDKAKLKTRLLSAWNNVRYRGWPLKSRPRLRQSSPVCLLGQSYQLSLPAERELFRQSFSSLLWMTYRKGFPALDGTRLRSDAGWGCMLRSAQMMLARALVLHIMPAGWTWAASHRETRDDLEAERTPHAGRPRRLSLEGGAAREAAHRLLVSCFADCHSAPFSLHRLVEWGRPAGKRAGDWYGPNTAAHILEKAVSASELFNLAVYVAQDCTVYTEDVLKLCGTSRSGRPVWKALLLLVPVRLGSVELNPIYSQCVKGLLDLRCCVGIIGGKPKHSLFFVGYQDDQLIYLDPHYCQAAVDVQTQDFPLESYHCRSVRKMPLLRMDPCCTMGFYCSSRADFHRLRSDATQVLSSSQQKYPVFTFVEGHKEEERICPPERPDLDLDMDLDLNLDLDQDFDPDLEEFVLL